jgi:hypothetical protein
VRESGILNNNVIVKMPIGTNFKILPHEYSRLCKFINDLGETAPPVLSGGQENG